MYCKSKNTSITWIRSDKRKHLEEATICGPTFAPTPETAMGTIHLKVLKKDSLKLKYFHGEVGQ